MPCLSLPKRVFDNSLVKVLKKHKWGYSPSYASEKYFCAGLKLFIQGHSKGATFLNECSCDADIGFVSF